jgi:hypothetical protein
VNSRSYEFYGETFILPVNAPGNVYLSEERLQLAAARKRLILSAVGERPVVNVTYACSKKSEVVSA